jgi:hypothetical protein
MSCSNCEQTMDKRCFGEYCAFNNNCDHCDELERYCKMWRNNMLNFKRRRNLALFICFIILVIWNFKIELDFLKTNLNSFAVLNFSVILLFLSALGKSIESRRKAMKAYKAHMAGIGKSQIKSSVQT